MPSEFKTPALTQKKNHMQKLQYEDRGTHVCRMKLYGGSRNLGQRCEEEHRRHAESPVSWCLTASRLQADE